MHTKTVRSTTARLCIQYTVLSLVLSTTSSTLVRTCQLLKENSVQCVKLTIPIQTLEYLNSAHVLTSHCHVIRIQYA